MKQIASPIFQSFLVLLSQSQIDGWTSNKIWKNLNLSKDEKHKINQQQLYRLLRKLVKQGHLIKNINSNNSRLSTFFETESMIEFRQKFSNQVSASDLSKIIKKKEELTEKKKECENQLNASEQALYDFPNLKNEILFRRKELLTELSQTDAYALFLNRLISSS